MRILLFGKNGQLGWELQRTLAPLGEIIAWDVDELDLTRVESIGPAIREAAPQIIVNASAYTAVDRAEQESEIAYLVNAAAPEAMAQEAKKLGAWFVHYSTDYVFDGAKGAPYVETDAPNPINVYGRSKLEGEQGVLAADGISLILRTSWVYSLRQESFVTKVLQWARQQETMRMLAEISAALIAKAQALGGDWLAERKGVYHLAGEGAVSRYAWAKEILRLDPQMAQQCVHSVEPASSDDFQTVAQRPAYSALNCRQFVKDFRLEIPSWAIALHLAMQITESGTHRE